MIKKIIMNHKILQLFNEHNIYFNANGSERIKEGDVVYINYNENASGGGHLEQNISFNSGYNICTMGYGSYSNSIIPFKNNHSLKIGRYCSLASNIQIRTFSHHIDTITTSTVVNDRNFIIFKNIANSSILEYDKISFVNSPLQDKKYKDIVIGNDVYIGENVVLYPGITIGTGSVIAANSVITKDIPCYEIWGGNPAKFIKKRFNDKIINRLLNSSWWDYNIYDIFGEYLDKPFVDNLDILEENIQKCKKIKHDKLYFSEIINSCDNFV